MRKKDLIQFFVWMRNGTAFCISWFLLLLVIAHSLSHTESISTLALAKMMLLSAGGSCCSAFSSPACSSGGGSSSPA